jgi:hypothetical protein
MAFGSFNSASGRCLARALLRLDQRVRSVTGPAHPVKLRTSGLCDQRVRSARLQLNLLPNGSIRRGTSINTRWLAQGSLSCILGHTCEHFELSNSPPLISLASLHIRSEIE